MKVKAEISNIVESAFVVKHAGMLTLLQDLGRFGQSHLGLTHGGPADKLAFDWANRLLNNNVNDAVLELTFGGMKLQANMNTVICITGANMPLTINGKTKKLWQTQEVNKGDILEFGFASYGVKSYLAVAGGFQIAKQFGSVATVVREKIGGLNGEPLQQNDKLAAVQVDKPSTQRTLNTEYQPKYSNEITLRAVLGYQQGSFSSLQKAKFFSSEYQVSKQWNRMGYRLEGQAISSNKTSMLSEGIVLGAIQIPPDGQPIILMHDRQTIGGYPKIGSVLSLDVSRLAQCGQGAKIRFQAITIDDAHNELHLAKHRYDNTPVSESFLGIKK